MCIVGLCWVQVGVSGESDDVKVWMRCMLNSYTHEVTLCCF